MKSIKILASALAVAALVLSGCVKNTINEVGIDNSKAGVTDLNYDAIDHASDQITLRWSAEAALAAGATSFSAQLSETLDGKGVDMYDATKGVTVKATEETEYKVTLKGQVIGKKYYVRVRANYPRSKYSPWTYICDEAGNPLIYKVGRGMIPEGPEEPYLYKVTPTSTGIIVKWDNIEGAANYHIEFKKAAEAEWVDSVIAAGNTVLKIKGLPSETEYNVRACTEFTDASRSIYTETFTVKTRMPGSFPKTMATAQELIDWLEGGIVEAEVADTYGITQDIDLAGQTFVAMDENFMGTFTGNGHTVKGVSATVFYKNEGTIKDVKIQMNDQTFDGNEYAALVPENLGTISGVEVKAKISCPSVTDGEIHVGGITVINRGTIENTVFDGSISVSGKAISSAVIIGGIAALDLDGGVITGSTNKAGITLSASDTFTGFGVAGIVGFLDGQVIDCTNEGALSASASYAKGKCTVYKIGSGLPGIGGIVAYSVPGSTATKFLIKGCTNNGGISYGLSAIDKYTSSYNRNQFGGIVANPNGNVEDCTNNGKVNISVKTSTGAAHTAEHIVCVGGIGGGDYFAGNDGAGAAATQYVTSYINCVNNGEIAIDTDVNSSNSAVGGICGWPGVEAARDNVTSGCTNNGKLVLNGCGKVRMGGIHGGIGNIENSINNGSVIIETADVTSCIGGISGFMSQALYIKNCESYGSVISNIASTQGVGGLVGNQGNAKSEVTGCKVRCKVVNGDVDNTGMLVGYWNGTSNKCIYGSAAAPISVAGKISIGGVPTALTSANYTSYLQGSRNASGHDINTVFDPTPYVDPDGGGSDEPVVEKLGTPQNVAVEMLYNSAIVTWDAVSGAEWYCVEYKIAGTEGEWTVIDRIEATECTIDGALEHGKTYAFRVKAFSTNASAYSEEATEDTYEEVIIAKPVFKGVPDVTSAAAKVAWEPVENAVVYYVQYKKADVEAWNTPAEVEATEYTVTGLEESTEYQIRVKAVGAGLNEGEWNDPITIRTVGPQKVTINTADEFTEWINNTAATWGESDQVTLGADIDMTGKTINPTSYAGIFNGNGKTIKNLVATLPIFTTTGGPIKDFTIDESCTLTIPASGNVGIIGTSAGAVEGITCSATIVTPVKVTAAYHLGAIVGESTGTVKGCTNNSAIKFDLSANAGSHSIGGVVGYFDVAKGVVAVENCTNNGEIQFKVTGTPKNDYIGGVVGSTAVHKRASVVYGGTVKGCVNTGKVSQVWTLSASGSYCNVGGVAGYIEGDIENCENSGEVSIISPDDVSASSTRPAIGGVCGYIGYNAKSCTNKGVVTAKGVYAAGTEGNAGALGCHQPLFGGVFGGAGIAYQAAASEGAIEDCHNKANVSFVVEQKKDGGTQSRLGGIVGYSSVPLTGCTNTGALTFKPGHAKSMMGGIVGYACKDVTSCINEGRLDYNGRADELVPADANASGQIYLAGIVGYTAEVVIAIKNCENKAPLTYTGQNATAVWNYFGGMIGHYGTGGITIEGCKNSGEMTVNAPCSLRFGGMAGAFNGTMTSCTFTGALKADKIGGDSSHIAQIGALAGYSNAVFNSNNSQGTITTSDVEAGYVGGVAGDYGGTGATWDGNQVNTQITTTLPVGSVLGEFDADAAEGTTYALHFINGIFGEKVSTLPLCGALKGHTLDTEAPAPASK